MKRLGALVLAGAALLALSGCSYSYSETPNSPANPATTEEYNFTETTYQLPDKRFVDCLEYRLSSKKGALTCTLTERAPAKGEFTPAADSFDVVYFVNSHNENLVCLDYRLGNNRGTISCVPGVAR